MSVRPAQFPTSSRAASSHTGSHADGRTDPVFVDRTGRRRRVAAMVATVAGLVLVLVALAMFVGFTGVGAGRLPGLPGVVDPAATQAPAPDRAAPPVPTGHTPRPSVTSDVPSPTDSVASPTRTSNGHRPSQTPSHPGKKK